MTRQRVADRGTECRVPLRCLLPDTDDFLETRRYSRVKAELRDNVEFCCDRWRVIITGKWDVVDMCVRTVCAWFWTVHLSFVALPCVHVHENRVWTIIIWLTRPLWSAACPTLTTKPGIENIESSIETWLKNGVRLSGLAEICCSLWLEFVLVTVDGDTGLPPLSIVSFLSLHYHHLYLGLLVVSGSLKSWIKCNWFSVH